MSACHAWSAAYCFTSEWSRGAFQPVWFSWAPFDYGLRKSSANVKRRSSDAGPAARKFPTAGGSPHATARRLAASSGLRSWLRSWLARCLGPGLFLFGIYDSRKEVGVILQATNQPTRFTIHFCKICRITLRDSEISNLRFQKNTLTSRNFLALIFSAIPAKFHEISDKISRAGAISLDVLHIVLFPF